MDHIYIIFDPFVIYYQWLELDDSNFSTTLKHQQTEIQIT